MSELLAADADAGIEVPTAVGAGRLRGLVLHKMLEEVLTGELAYEYGLLVQRARELLAQLIVPDDTAVNMLPEAEELGATVVRSLALSDIAPLRGGLVPEVSVFGTLPDAKRHSIAGRADAIFVANGLPQNAIDLLAAVSVCTRDGGAVYQ